MTKAMYKKTLKDGANIVALDDQVLVNAEFPSHTSFLQQGAGTWSACRGHSSENEGEMVGDEAGEGVHKPIEVGFHYFTGQP